MSKEFTGQVAQGFSNMTPPSKPSSFPSCSPVTPHTCFPWTLMFMRKSVFLVDGDFVAHEDKNIALPQKILNSAVLSGCLH